jgi:hypothetical protein
MPRKLMILNKWVWTKLLYWLLEHSWIWAVTLLVDKGYNTESFLKAWWAMWSSLKRLHKQTKAQLGITSDLSDSNDDQSSRRIHNSGRQLAGHTGKLKWMRKAWEYFETEMQLMGQK